MDVCMSVLVDWARSNQVELHVEFDSTFGVYKFTLTDLTERPDGDIGIKRIRGGISLIDISMRKESDKLSIVLKMLDEMLSELRKE